MPEKYIPTPDDRPEPESSRTSNTDFLSDLAEKLDAPLTPAERQKAAKAKRDQQRVVEDAKPQDSETFEQTLGNFESKMAGEVMEAQWEKLDEETQETDATVFRLHRDIVVMIHERKPDDLMARIGLETGGVWRKFENTRDSFLMGQTGLLEYKAILTDTEQRLRHYKSQLMSHQ